MSSLEVNDLRISVGGKSIVKGVSFSVGSGERMCLLGESGSGKSMTASAVLGRLPAGAKVSGSLKIAGHEVLGVPTSKRPPEARVAGVFQDSAVALNPLVRVRDQLMDPLRRNRKLDKGAALAEAIEFAESVGLPDPAVMINAFPAELSGGQRQRICIALALACQTRLMVADEPTTALDVVTQAKVLRVLEKYTAGENTPALLFITHDFAVASELCRDAVVLKDGQIVEQGRVREIFDAPKHDYTQSLIDAARAATIGPALQVSAAREAEEARKTHEAGTGAEARPPFFDVFQVSREFVMPRTKLFAPREHRVALKETSLTIREGERVGLVGSSGSGKTTLLRLMLALDRSDTGSIVCAGREVLPSDATHLAWYRKRVQYVPQDPASTLDPHMSVRDLVAEPLRRLGVEGHHTTAVVEALESVGLDSTYLKRRANELSGGQAQRVAIARAIATRPDFLLADEPVSGLDLPMREQVVALLSRICSERGTGLLVVSHDLSMVASLCRRTLVMHGGEVVEDRNTLDILTNPQHERSRELVAAIPELPTANVGVAVGAA